MSLRSALLTLALLATLAAAYWAPPPAGDEIVAPAKPRGAGARLNAEASGVVPHAPGAMPALRERTPETEPTPVAMAEPQWLQKPQPPAPPLPPVSQAPAELPPPSAPPLPFRLLGRYIEGDAPAYFLQFNDQSLVVRKGDVIAQTYRVEQMDDTALTLLHLPTNQRQTMNMGVAK